MAEQVASERIGVVLLDEQPLFAVGSGFRFVHEAYQCIQAAGPHFPAELFHAEITLLGTGTPTPSLKRCGSGYLIETGASLIVMDLGPGALQRFLQTRRRFTEITHAFFSHLHYDHCIDYPRLVLQRWDQGAGRIADLQVYGPPPLKRMTDLLFAADGVFAPDIEARVQHQGSIDIYRMRGGQSPRKPPAPLVRELSPGSVVDGPDWAVRVGEAQHVQPYLRCLAFRIDAEGGSMCYSGDSGGRSDEIIRLAAGCDVLIHMVHYMSGSEPTEIYRQVCGNHLDTAYIARQADVKTLVLSHILEQIDQPGVREKILAEMAREYRGNIIWGEDLMEVPLGEISPARMR